jgi:hypothetical protein
MKAIGILISPAGEEFFDAYGPMTKDRAKATRFASAAVARRAAAVRFGRAFTAFWGSEREHEERARKEFTGWTNRVEEVTE